MLYYTMTMWEHRSALTVIRDSSESGLQKNIYDGKKFLAYTWFTFEKIGLYKWLFKLAEGIFILESSSFYVSAVVDVCVNLYKISEDVTSLWDIQ